MLRSLLGALQVCGGIARLGLRVLAAGLRPPYEIRLWMDQLFGLGYRSLSIALITALFTGMVLALQTAVSLAPYGGKIFIGDIVSLSLVRELGPVLTSLLVAGRVGAGITAELGTMAVTEQIDAIRALAADPVRKLVVPKVLAVVVMLPLLTVLADVVGIFGGMFVASYEFGQPMDYFRQRVVTALTVGDVMTGLGKTVFFAIFIALIACYNGINVRGGADGVGRATTTTVVSASITVLISDYFLTKLFLLL